MAQKTSVRSFRFPRFHLQGPLSAVSRVPVRVHIPGQRLASYSQLPAKLSDDGFRFSHSSHRSPQLRCCHLGNFSPPLFRKNLRSPQGSHSPASTYHSAPRTVSGFPGEPVFRPGTLPAGPAGPESALGSPCQPTPAAPPGNPSF